MTQTHRVLIRFAVCIVGYPIAMRLIAMSTQPLRLRMAALGHALLTDSTHRLTADHARFVRSMLESAYDFRFAIVMVWALPAFVFGRLTGRRTFGIDALPEDVTGDRIRELSRLHTISVAAANPIFFLVVIAEAALLGFVAVPFALIRGSRTVDKVLELQTFAALSGERFLTHSNV